MNSSASLPHNFPEINGKPITLKQYQKKLNNQIRNKFEIMQL